MPQRPLDANNKDNVTRATVSLTTDVYKELEKIALENGVSVSWVIRNAVDNYLKSRKEDE